jgi:predicted enzyme related to lactoylglutathione lyase
VEAGGSVLVPPTETGVAAVADPSGVPFGLTDRAAAEVVGEPGAWAMSALHTPDVQAATAFYGAVFGWEAEPAGPDTPLVFWRLAGEVVAVMTPTTPEVPPHWAVNFRTDDVDALAAKAVELGGTLLMAPTDAPGFRNAVIGDPQQGVIAVSQPIA